METSRSNIVEKKGYERGILEDDAEHVPGSKKPKLPALAIVIVEAVKVDSLQRLCSSLEPLLRKFISVDTLVKRAYDTWHEVIEYDSQVLNSLASTKKKIRASAALAPIADPKYASDQNSKTIQNGQQNISEPGTHCHCNHQSVPWLIEFPFLSSRQTPVMTLNYQQEEFSSSIDCMSLGTSAVGGSYFSKDWSLPRNGQGSEDLFAEEIRLRSAEMLVSDDMQRLLNTYSMGVGVEMGAGFGLADEACFSCSAECL